MTVLAEAPAQQPTLQAFAHMPYAEYRALCDQTDSFRHLGVLDEEAYDATLRDATTSFFRIGHQLVPSLVKIDYEGGYDAAKTQELTATELSMLLAVPLHVALREDADMHFAGGWGISESVSVLVEDPQLSKLSEEAREQLARKFSWLGAMTVREFEDKPAPKGNDTAWMGLYAFSYGMIDHEAGAPVAAVMEAAWDDYRKEKDLPLEPTADSNGTYMFTGAQLQANPDLVNELWGITKLGFGKQLGANHPVSMEETREFFEERLFLGQSFTVIRFADGQPMCFGSLTQGFENCPWMNPNSSQLKQQIDDSRSKGEIPIYFSEVISKGQAGSGYARGIFDCVIDLTHRLPHPIRLLFESTNRSSRYIPRGVQRAFDEFPNVELKNPSGKIELIDKLDYWYLGPEDKHE